MFGRFELDNGLHNYWFTINNTADYLLKTMNFNVSQEQITHYFTKFTNATVDFVSNDSSHDYLTQLSTCSWQDLGWTFARNALQVAQTFEAPIIRNMEEECTLLHHEENNATFNPSSSNLNPFIYAGALATGLIGCVGIGLFARREWRKYRQHEEAQALLAREESAAPTANTV